MSKMCSYLILLVIRILYVVTNITFGILTIICVILGPTLYIIFGSSVFDVGNKISDEIDKWFNNKLEKYSYAKH